MIKKIRAYLDDPDLDVQYKSFILLSIIALVGIFLALVGGIVISQSIFANLTILIEFVLFSAVFFGSVWFNKLDFAMIFIASFLVFVFLPLAFFTSGGAAGGTPVWYAFGTLYILMVLGGKPKIVFLVLQSIVICVCWWIGFNNPELIIEFTREEAFIDSILTLFIVGTIMAILINYQRVLFRRENERVRMQKAQIEGLIRSQNLFFSAMSHEIRTPINSILGLNEVILRQDDASDEIIKDASNIRGAGRMLLALINDLLDLSKIEAGKMDIVPVDYNIGNLVSEIAGMISPRAKDKGLKFDVDITPNVPTGLFGDEVRIKQIIINILNNSVKYTLEGSVGLRIRSDKIGNDSVKLFISVSDTGIGIKEEALPDLFDAYKRMDQEKNRNIEGTGLGLSIVKQLVDLMDGIITVDSTYGSGTTFTVCIPQKVSDPKPLGDFRVDSVDAARKRNGHLFSAPDASILIVDDNEMNLEVETKLLAGTLIGMDTAISGAEALNMTKDKHYDVILMDHLMPVMSGIDCLAAIRAQIDGLNAGVPVVVLTANADGEHRELYRKSGFDGYLVKPVTGRQMEEMLMKHIPKGKIRPAVEEETKAEDSQAGTGSNVKAPRKQGNSDKKAWYERIEGIRGTDAVENCGSDETFRTMLKFFYRSIPKKASEIEEYYGARDWENYTIKVHALKSSAKLVGADKLADLAQKLENAGNERNESFIDEHHAELIGIYRGFSDSLAEIAGDKKKRILIIDDDALYASIIKEWLKDSYSVESFTDGKKAVDWLAENGTDLILLDYKMPGVDGPKVLEMLRSNADTASIPVLFLTGAEPEDSALAVMDLKPHGFIHKSISREELRKNIEAIFA